VRIHVLLELKKSGGQAAQALGRSRSGFTTKVHVTVDGLGNPLRLRLTAGHRHDITRASELVGWFSFDYLIADRGYTAQDFVAWEVECGMQPVIPPHQRVKETREYDR
jgi:transposase